MKKDRFQFYIKGKRIAAILTAVCLCMAALAGCGSKESKEPAESSAPAEPAASSGSAVPTGNAGTAEAAEIGEPSVTETPAAEIEETEEPAPQVVLAEDTGEEEVLALVTVTGKPVDDSVGKQVTADTEPASPDLLTIVFAGDIIFERSQNPGIVKAYSSGIRACFDEETLEIMESADLFVINNEFPYTDRGTPLPGKQFTFRCSPDTVSWMRDIGADLICLANNHIYDYGYDGAMDTFDTLDEAGFVYIGAGRDLEDATKTAYFSANGMCVAILNATMIERYENPDTRGAGEDSPGVFRCLDSEMLCEEVRKAKEYADYVIVYDHWGTELMETADQSQIDQAWDLYEAGADLVVGAHPHILQNIEYIEEMPVFYSLGNYFFSASTRDNGVLRITLDTHTGKAESLQFIPMVQKHGVYTLEGSDKERVLDKMRSVSPGVEIDDEGYFWKE